MVLACDTSSQICSVAVAAGQEILFHKDTTGPQIHIEKLSVFLNEALVEFGHDSEGIEALAIAIGPGSFNGLRIGLATMKALALALDLPVIPIKTTDAMAYGLRGTKEGRGRAVIFSHRNFIHFADYNVQNDRIPSASEFNYGTWDQLASAEIDFYFGMAERGFQDWLGSKDGQTVSGLFYSASADARNVARYAESVNMDSIPSLDELEPFYNARYEAKKWVPPKF